MKYILSYLNLKYVGKNIKSKLFYWNNGKEIIEVIKKNI